MRKIMCMIPVMVSFCLRLSGQILDGSFSNMVFTSGDCSGNNGSSQTTATSPFVACNFQGWSASHGTPEIYTSGGNNRAAMWSGYWNNNSVFGGEGLYANCWFYKGKTYHLTLKMATSASDPSSLPVFNDYISNVYIKLANVLPIVTSVDYSSSPPLYAVPSVVSTQIIYHATNLSSPNSWQNIDIYFTPNDDYVDLWIYPEHFNGPQTVSVLIIDDVSIDDCLPDVTFSNTSGLPGLTLRSDYIQAINNTQVLNNQNVVFSAGNYVYLGPDFYVNNGGVFNAYIGGCEQLLCSNPNYRIAGTATIPGSQQEVSLFPNPTSGVFSIQIGAEKDCSVYVLDIMGNVLFQKTNILEPLVEFDLSEQPSGIYMVKICKSGKVDIKKVIKD